MRSLARYTLPLLSLGALLLSGLTAKADPTPPTLTYTATPFTNSISFIATTTYSSNPAFADNGPYGLGFTNGNEVFSGNAPQDITFTYLSTGSMSYHGSGNLSGQAPETPVPGDTPVELIDFTLTGYENAPNTEQYAIAAFDETQYELNGGEILAAVYPLGWNFTANPSDFHFSTPTDPIEPDDPLHFELIATIPDGFHVYDSNDYNAYDPTGTVVTPLNVTPTSTTPEPSSIVPFVFGGLGLVGLALRKRRTRS